MTNDSDPPLVGINRRSALNIAIGSTTAVFGAAIVYPITRFLTAPLAADEGALEVVVAKAEEIAPATAIAFNFGDKPALLVKDASGKVRAFIAICTHLQCVVQFKDENKSIWCACHDGYFDLAGHHLKGPPPRPLTELGVEQRGDDLVVIRRA